MLEFREWMLKFRVNVSEFVLVLATTGSARFDREFKMTVHAPKLLTPEEFASLIEIAITSPTPAVPAPHLAKLISLGYVVVTSKGPLSPATV